MAAIDYTISTDRSKLKTEAVKALLNQSYWADQRTEEIIAKSIENSLCYGVFIGDELVGFGRAVTDFATVYWICDIIIDKNHRGQNLGKRLMESIMETGALNGLLGILATKDAHGLYEQYGFVKEPVKCMMKKRQNATAG